jgi:hypothetical protein
LTLCARCRSRERQRAALRWTIAAPTGQYCEVPQVTLTFEEQELELVERTFRVIAERARRDAERAKGTTVERLHREAREKCLRIAERIKAARGKPDPEPPPSNVRRLR